MSEIEIPKWAERLVHLSESLLEAGVDWSPSFSEPPVRVEIRVRRGAHLPPELAAEMKSALEMLRELVARTATTENLEELLRRCEDNARHQERYAADPGSGRELAERWRDLASRVAALAMLGGKTCDDLEAELLPPGPVLPLDRACGKRVPLRPMSCYIGKIGSPFFPMSFFIVRIRVPFWPMSSFIDRIGAPFFPMSFSIDRIRVPFWPMSFSIDRIGAPAGRWTSSQSESGRRSDR